jgi:hypothetical protein
MDNPPSPHPQDESASHGFQERTPEAVPGPTTVPYSPIWVMHVVARTETLEIIFIGVLDSGWTVYVACQHKHGN